ncbi:EF-hand domain-containing protein [Sphingomonas sp. HF-S4]|uniref:EF-hand domain-containing protein n=1 Tax=Sphingomonas agrestis TaxID=3080540 RepID=A0ABU3Y5E8_9SPHN|nr:EF-hand domain-containing protein [Sphingomonas sp. HF-S4]MDV3456428.1 EF-hand domain-containing protein [Sphingomonas sp. HF-S4]
MKKTLAALLGASLLATPVLAAPQAGDMFAKADANGDGAVTQAEFLADVDARFAGLDANKDGKISKDERPGNGERGGRMLNRLDTDGDGAISLAEQRAQATKRFARLDTNGDGKLDQAERAAARERMRGMMERRSGGE